MAKGQPDFGAYAPTETIVGLSDLGELAARLGSIITFDRRGNVAWLDNFESGIEKWRTYSAAGGASLEWIATHARNGGFCAKLSTDNHTDDDVMMLRYLPYPMLSRIGIEVNTEWSTYLKTFTLNLYLDNGTGIHEGKVRWTKDTQMWACYANGAWQDLAPITNLDTKATLFHTVKLVCDFVKNKYVRLRADATEFDLKDKVIKAISPADAPFLSPRIQITTPSNNVATIYVDDIIITQNEP